MNTSSTNLLSSSLSVSGTGQQQGGSLLPSVQGASTASGPATAASASQNAEKEIHSLTLKVMRLSKPGFQLSIPLICEKDEIADFHLSNEDLRLDNDNYPFGVSELLTLPHSFGFGETFTSYISVHNQSPFDVKNVTVKSELQTATQRFNLLDISASPIVVFASGESHDYVIQHEIKEGGIHILVCTVNYVKHDGEKKYFRKFFRFQVMNPISIKTQTHDLQHGTFLSAQIKNVAQSPLFLESVKFEPMPLFSLVDINSQDTNVNNVGDIAYMKPGDVRQYLFRLDAKNPADPRAKVRTETCNTANMQTASIIGKMDIIWKGNLGETGRLQTAPLERKVEVDMTIRKIPQHIILEQPFTVQCDITNRSDKVIVPRLVFVKALMSGIMANGLSGQVVGNGKLTSGSTQSIPLTLFPMKPGVHKITGFRVVDDQSQKTYDFNDIIDVFVET